MHKCIYIYIYIYVCRHVQVELSPGPPASIRVALGGRPLDAAGPPAAAKDTHDGGWRRHVCAQV